MNVLRSSCIPTAGAVADPRGALELRDPGVQLLDLLLEERHRLLAVSIGCDHSISGGSIGEYGRPLTLARARHRATSTLIDAMTLPAWSSSPSSAAVAAAVGAATTRLGAGTNASSLPRSKHHSE